MKSVIIAFKSETKHCVRHEFEQSENLSLILKTKLFTLTAYNYGTIRKPAMLPNSQVISGGGVIK